MTNKRRNSKKGKGKGGRRGSRSNSGTPPQDHASPGGKSLQMDSEEDHPHASPGVSPSAQDFSSPASAHSPAQENMPQMDKLKISGEHAAEGRSNGSSPVSRLGNSSTPPAYSSPDISPERGSPERPQEATNGPVSNGYDASPERPNGRGASAAGSSQSPPRQNASDSRSPPQGRAMESIASQELPNDNSSRRGLHSNMSSISTFF